MPEFNPSFLIAVPQLGDPNFFHSIVLILEHTQKGALGLVINDPAELDLGTFAENHALSCHSNVASMQVFRGGPIELEGGWILHTDEKAPEKQVVLPGLYISGSQDTLKHLLETGFKKMRLILGYAGWGAGQLDIEIAKGSWISSDVNVVHIFDTEPGMIWNSVLSDMGIEPSQLMLGGGMH
jgi:putative transcriptional regulator